MNDTQREDAINIFIKLLWLCVQSHECFIASAGNKKYFCIVYIRYIPNITINMSIASMPDLKKVIKSIKYNVLSISIKKNSE